MNSKGQAMIEALIAGALSLLSLYFIFIYGIKIIHTTINQEKIEEQYVCRLTGQNDC